MKSVLISICPKWIEKIANGQKTIEVRKTAPKCEVPFKCYIYCTKTRDNEIYKRYKVDDIKSDKVIGEFVCDKIERFRCASVPYKKENNLGYGRFLDNGVYKVDGWCEGIVFERNDRYIDTMLKNKELDEMSLSAQEIFDYIGIGKHLYGWHISDLKIYDKPKGLSEFYRPCSYSGICYSCNRFRPNGTPNDKPNDFCDGEITRPPQSWFYVEEL